MATDRTVTVKSADGDYTSLQAALAAEAGDLPTLDRRLIIECYDMEDTTAASTAGQVWVTDATRYIWIKAAGDHGGKWNTGVYRHKIAAGGNSIVIDMDHGVDHIEFSGIQFDMSNHTTAGAGLVSSFESSANVGWLKVNKCIFMGNSNLVGYGISMSSSGFKLLVNNCIFYGILAAVRWNQTFAGYIYGCTIDDCDIGINTGGANTHIKGTRITNPGTNICNAEAIALDSDYNLTDASTDIPGTWGDNSIDGTDTPTLAYVDSDNANYASRDYHLETGDSGLGVGTNLSSDPDLPFSDDIDGETRSAWDIGADEFSSGDTPIVRIVSETVGV